jgi:hypothetical protein
MKRTAQGLAATAALVTVAASQACATGGVSPADLPARALTGHFTMAEGASWFRPCGAAPGDTLWWTTFLGGAIADRDSLVAAGRIRPGTAAYLRLIGAPGDLQPAGPAGQGTRYLYVREVTEAREQRAGDCSSPGGL